MDKFKNKYRIPSNRKPNYDYSSNGLYFLTIVTQHRICNLGSILNGKMTLSEFGKIVEMEWFKSFEIRDELFLDEFILMPNHLHAIVEICNGDNNDENNTRNEDGHDENGIDDHGGRDDHDRHDRIDDHDRNGGRDDRDDHDRNDGHNRIDGHDRNGGRDRIVKTHGRASLRSPSTPPPSKPPPSAPSQSIQSQPISPPHTQLTWHAPSMNDMDIKIKRNAPIQLPKSISSFIAGFKSAVNTKIDDHIDEYKLALPKYNRNNHFFQPNYHDHIIRNDREYHAIKRYIVNNPKNWKGDKFTS